MLPYVLLFISPLAKWILFARLVIKLVEQTAAQKATVASCRAFNPIVKVASFLRVRVHLCKALCSGCCCGAGVKIPSPACLILLVLYLWTPVILSLPNLPFSTTEARRTRFGKELWCNHICSVCEVFHLLSQKHEEIPYLSVLTVVSCCENQKDIQKLHNYHACACHILHYRKVKLKCIDMSKKKKIKFLFQGKVVVMGNRVGFRLNWLEWRLCCKHTFSIHQCALTVISVFKDKKLAFCSKAII